MRARGGYYWVGPALVLLLVIIIVPLLFAVAYSFTHYSYSVPGYNGQFCGLDNYREALDDAKFGGSLVTTLKIVVPTLTLEFAFGFVLAFFLYGQRKFSKIILPILVVPMTVSPAVVGLVGNLSLNPEFGIVGQTLKYLGVSDTSVLGEPFSALVAIIMADIWQWTPFMTLIFLAGLLSFPKEPYEAAQIDGARPIQTIRLVTVPLMLPLMTIATLLRFIDIFKIFDTIWIMTVGGPGSATEALSIYAYRVNFMHWNLGYGSAIIMLLLLINYTICFLFYKYITSAQKQQPA